MKQSNWEDELEYLTEKHIASLTWGKETDDYTRTLVMGNIRYFSRLTAKDFISQLLATQRKELLEEIENIPTDAPEFENDSYDAGRKSFLKDIKQILNSLK